MNTLSKSDIEELLAPVVEPEAAAIPHSMLTQCGMIDPALIVAYQTGQSMNSEWIKTKNESFSDSKK